MLNRIVILPTIALLIILAIFLYCFIIYNNKEQAVYNKIEISQRLINNIDWQNIRYNLHEFTSELHPAGTLENNRLAEKIARKWRENGLENVHFVNYGVLLSYPNYSDPNRITIFDSKTEKIIFENTGVSPVILPEEQNSAGAGVQWLAYSPSGVVEAEVVYCHYGNVKDFERLEKFGVSIKGKIALMRFHSEFRGAKVRNAQLRGALGAILYTDPMEFAAKKTDYVYPDSVWMPRDETQRGTIKMFNGDPLTPLYPSRFNLFRYRDIEEAKELGDLPSIPALPLSYGDAYEILMRLGGEKAPKDWKGSLNVTYRLGPGFQGNNKFRMKVNSQLIKREIQNVIGYLYGSQEPDEYVILGNHYDAWVYGSIDPNSGTAALAEVARALVQTSKETGWRPLRSIVFCNWDAEEYGLIGSTEFVEDFTEILSDRAIVYLNVDMIVPNKTFNADTIPSLYDVVVNAAGKIQNPVASERESGRMSMLDTWIKNNPSRLEINKMLPKAYPKMDVPGAGSDHAPFLHYLGIPVVNFCYQNTSQDYPLYHTMYETTYLNEFLYDHQNLSVHRAVAQFWAEITREFADAIILPVNVHTFASVMFHTYIANLEEMIQRINRTDDLTIVKQQMQYLSIECEELLLFTNEWNDKIKKLEKDLKNNKVTSWRTPSGINRRLKRVERCFINSRGIPNVADSRHVLYAPSNNDAYLGDVMPAVYSQIALLNDQNLNLTTDEVNKIVKELANQISIVNYSIQCVKNTLNKYI